MSSISMAEISRLDLQKLKAVTPASITNIKELSSYNWIEAPSNRPTIAIPGSPALWSPTNVSRQLQKDSGLVYVSQNAARHPDSPLEPLFRALYAENSKFDIRSTEVVTDRNNIRKLLSFVDHGSSGSELEPFSINVEVMKNTAMFCRNETKTTEYIGPGDFRGFGHEFEKTYTRAQIAGSTGHHRIISYHFGGLKFIVRHETDGFVETNAQASLEAMNRGSEDLSGMLGALAISSTNDRQSSARTGSKLVIMKRGKTVPLESTIEIKTRVQHRPLQIEDVALQLWVSQTPRLVRAYHRNGRFQEPVVENVASAVKRWEECRQNDLGKLAALIRRIIDLAKACGGKAVIRYDAERDNLVVRRVHANDMLPKDLYQKWDDALSIEDQTGTQHDSTRETSRVKTRREHKLAVSPFENGLGHDADSESPHRSRSRKTITRS